MQFPYLDLNLSITTALEALSVAEARIHENACAEDGDYMPTNVKAALFEIQVARNNLERAVQAIVDDVERESLWEAEAEALADAQSY